MRLLPPKNLKLLSCNTHELIHKQEQLIHTRNTATCAREYSTYMAEYNPVDKVEMDFRFSSQINVSITFTLVN